MKPSRVVGIGCFGSPRTFSGILDKILENYSLALVNAGATDKQESPGADQWPVSPVSGNSESPGEKVLNFWTGTRRVAGFCLSLMEKGPSLSIFARRPGEKPDRFSWRHGSSLELRKTRLN